MKKTIILLFIGLMASCVQKSYEQTVTFTVDVSGFPQKIESVGLRGEGKPLSWQEDLAMNEIVKDSLYSVSLTAETGYKFVEVKFVVNGEFELQNEDNRRIYFDQDFKTDYKAIFNKK